MNHLTKDTTFAIILLLTFLLFVGVYGLALYIRRVLEKRKPNDLEEALKQGEERAKRIGGSFWPKDRE